MYKVKKLDILTEDIRNDFSSVDDACAKLAERIWQGERTVNKTEI